MKVRNLKWRNFSLFWAGCFAVASVHVGIDDAILRFSTPGPDHYAELSGGDWSVCLVDTRDARDVPAGVVGGIPKRINRWGVVESGVTLESATAATAQAAAVHGVAPGGSEGEVGHEAAAGFDAQILGPGESAGGAGLLAAEVINIDQELRRAGLVPSVQNAAESGVVELLDERLLGAVGLVDDAVELAERSHLDI